MENIDFKETYANIYPYHPSPPNKPVEIPPSYQTKELSEEAMEAIKAYMEYAKLERENKALKEEARKKVKKLLGDNEVGEFEDNIAFWELKESRSFDTKCFKNENYQLYEKYRKPQTNRKLKIVKKPFTDEK